MVNLIINIGKIPNFYFLLVLQHEALAMVNQQVDFSSPVTLALADGQLMRKQNAKLLTIYNNINMAK